MKVINDVFNFVRTITTSALAMSSDLLQPLIALAFCHTRGASQEKAMSRALRLSLACTLTISLIPGSLCRRRRVVRRKSKLVRE
ncbi:hypothetical protein HBI18_013090 [Parastagonospora nodorum]|nr:hypothetical protein HBI78_031560 [Parastagonospora nodorum]KAH5108943.1 hypothetical protein HBH72_036380 [Parastagonospora nodorum]KAH5195771.1 hypothetical protein HBH76_048520 [Parastagonospora nodorum]KAH5220801.1 hypothetical protein HBH77_039430 [Parastagonospora nodorum]KAH5682538.1 hypothetical protein HBI21_043360 [Parastagonospora nodorum]